MYISEDEQQSISTSFRKQGFETPFPELELSRHAYGDDDVS
jgi:hypothetical protein